MRLSQTPAALSIHLLAAFLPAMRIDLIQESSRCRSTCLTSSRQRQQGGKTQRKPSPSRQTATIFGDLVLAAVCWPSLARTSTSLVAAPSSFTRRSQSPDGEPTPRSCRMRADSAPPELQLRGSDPVRIYDPPEPPVGRDVVALHLARPLVRVEVERMPVVGDLGRAVPPLRGPQQC